MLIVSCKNPDCDKPVLYGGYCGKCQQKEELWKKSEARFDFY